jgi:hypothetical protein
MKDDTYIVEFVNNSGSERVSAGNWQSAAIKACALRLNKGFHCSIQRITNVDRGEQTTGEVFLSLTINNIEKLGKNQLGA